MPRQVLDVAVPFMCEWGIAPTSGQRHVFLRVFDIHNVLLVVVDRPEGAPSAQNLAGATGSSASGSMSPKVVSS